MDPLLSFRDFFTIWRSLPTTPCLLYTTMRFLLTAACQGTKPSINNQIQLYFAPPYHLVPLFYQNYDIPQGTMWRNQNLNQQPHQISIPLALTTNLSSFEESTTTTTSSFVMITSQNYNTIELHLIVLWKKSRWFSSIMSCV